MNGHVDEWGRALVAIQLRNPVTRAINHLDAWVDTAFNGELVLPQALITQMGLPTGPTFTATLADGTTKEILLHKCNIDWFGSWRRVTVSATENEIALLGVGLLLGHRLTVDYTTMTVELI